MSETEQAATELRQFLSVLNWPPPMSWLWDWRIERSYLLARRAARAAFSEQPQLRG